AISATTSRDSSRRRSPKGKRSELLNVCSAGELNDSTRTKTPGERCALAGLVRLRTALLFVAGLATVACGSSATTSTNVTAPASTRCEATVSAQTTSFASAGGTASLSISVDRECSWTASSPVNWISFTTPTSGQGNGSLGYRVAENVDPIARQASLSVAAR